MSSPPQPAPNANAVRVRSRAKKACQACNARRVRCDVTEKQPCSNCKTADVPCELIKSRRGKYDRAAKFGYSASQGGSSKPGDVFRRTSHDSSHEDGPSELPDSANILYHGRSASGSLNNSISESGLLPNMHMTTPDVASSSTETIEGNYQESCIYLGESNSISLIHRAISQTRDYNSPKPKTRLQYPIPETVSLSTPSTPYEARRRAAKIKSLSEDGALVFPPRNVCEVLLKAYFTWFHPCFPILDRANFYQLYTTSGLSPLLFQAVLFVGATHCNEKTLRDVGLHNRLEARSDLYNHAKDIYDADYESDKITVCQALFLMSFWRAGPLLEKDTRHWLGTAIGLAQSKGMHRSLSSTKLGDARVRKRLWWSLYVRDRQCSAALGLPIRIRNVDCDIEMLEDSDFYEDDSILYPYFFGSQTIEHISYAIQMVKLSKFLGNIIVYEYSPYSERDCVVDEVVMNESYSGPDPNFDREKLKIDLLQWEAELPHEMRSTTSSSHGPGFWANMLHIAYNNLYILLYRSAFLGCPEDDLQSVGQFALQAACRNTRIIEDVLSQDLVQYGNVHIITSLFNSLCIHTINLRRSEHTARKLSEYRAQLCLLGLRELQKTWDVTNWVLQLFLQFLDQSIAKKLELSDNDDGPISQPQQTLPTTYPEDSVGPGLPSTSTAPPDAAFANVRMDGFSREGFLDQAFASQLFGTKEAEDFSKFQLQPAFYDDFYGGDLNHYYNSVMARGEGDQMYNMDR